jgi:hypothetical protein
LTSLFVNTENYRFEPLSSQKEAIDKMIEDQGDKLYSLVDDIVTNGLSPVDLIIVTPNEDSNKYVVLEGNRRITSLKLLNNPTLIDDKYSPLRKKFQKLQKEKPNAISELKNIACAVFETPTEADIWIKRKHSGVQFQLKNPEAKLGYSVEETDWEGVLYTQIGLFTMGKSNMKTFQWLFYNAKTQELYEFDVPKNTPILFHYQ